MKQVITDSLTRNITCVWVCIMIDLPFLGDVCRSTDSKIVLLVVDGLGGAPHPDTGKSELETAALPNLDALARTQCGWAYNACDVRHHAGQRARDT